MKPCSVQARLSGLALALVAMIAAACGDVSDGIQGTETIGSERSADRFSEEIAKRSTAIRDRTGCLPAGTLGPTRECLQPPNLPGEWYNCSCYANLSQAGDPIFVPFGTDPTAHCVAHCGNVFAFYGVRRIGPDIQDAACLKAINSAVDGLGDVLSTLCPPGYWPMADFSEVRSGNCCTVVTSVECCPL